MQIHILLVYCLVLNILSKRIYIKAMTKKKIRWLEGIEHISLPTSTSPIAVVNTISMPPTVVHVNLIQPPDSYCSIVAR